MGLGLDLIHGISSFSFLRFALFLAAVTCCL